MGVIYIDFFMPDHLLCFKLISGIFTNSTTNRNANRPPFSPIMQYKSNRPPNVLISRNRMPNERVVKCPIVGILIVIA